MGRQLQKKKNKAKVPKVLTKRKRKTLRHGNKKINVLGNALIAENWYGTRLAHEDCIVHKVDRY